MLLMLLANNIKNSNYIMKRRLVKVLLISAVIGLTACGEKTASTSKKDSGEAGYRWVTGVDVDKFGERYEYRELTGKDTVIYKYDNQGKTMYIRQKGFIDCGKYTTVKIKIDGKPAKDILGRPTADCKEAAIWESDKDRHDVNIQKEILAAKTLVIQLNPDGTYPGKTESLNVLQ